MPAPRAVSLQRQLHRSADGRRRSDRRCALRDQSGVGALRRQLRRRDAPRRPAPRTATVPALQGPFGSFPAYTVLDQLDFNEAGEETVVVGAAYDLSHIVLDGLKLQTRYGWAWDAIDAPSGEPLTRQNEFNVELEYLPTAGPLENIHVQVFYSMVELPGNPPGQNAAAAGARHRHLPRPPAIASAMSSPASHADPLRPFDARMLGVGDGHWLYVEEVGSRRRHSGAVPARRTGQRIAAPAPAAVRSGALPRASCSTSAAPGAATRICRSTPTRRSTSSPTSRRSASTSASSAGWSSAARGARRSPRLRRGASRARHRTRAARRSSSARAPRSNGRSSTGRELFRPDLYADFVELLPEAERADPLAAYLRRLADPDPAVQVPAAQTWAAYERALSELAPSQTRLSTPVGRSERLPPTPIIEGHYIRNDFFLEPGQLLRDARQAEGHSRRDRAGPLRPRCARRKPRMR